MSVPFFSIITPVFNGVHCLEGYVKGLQQQHCRDWEAIIIDDGSSDGTTALLQRFVVDDSRFRLARNTRPKQIPGPYEARNLGLKLSRGLWICFLDIDDVWFPDKLDQQARLLQARPRLQLLYGSHWRARPGCRHGHRRTHPPLLGPKRWMAVANPVPMLTACVRSDLARASRFKAIHHEDYLYWHALFSRLSADQIHADPQALALYRIDPSSLSANKWRASIWIWRCYRELGYSPLMAAAALALRGLLQLWYALQQLRAIPLPLDWPGSATVWPVIEPCTDTY